VVTGIGERRCKADVNRKLNKYQQSENSRPQRSANYVAKVVGATSCEGFLVILASVFFHVT